MQRAIIAVSSALFVALLLVAAPPRDAEAIPAFARKYNVSCSLCHSPVPALTDFGEDFAGNGFQFQKGAEPVDSVDTGDDLLVLMKDLPLAVRFDGYLRATAESDLPSTDLETPWGIKLLSGGHIARNVSYYMYFFMSERGEVAGLEDAYVQFTDLGGSGIDLLAGQFQVSDPLFKRELRLEFEDYQAYRVRVGDVRADLTYDRGLMAVLSPWEGADVSLQIVNGRGISAASEEKVYDGDDGKNFAARVSQALGPIRVGGFGYLGTESAGGITSDIRVFGPDVSVALGPAFELNGQYLRRTDETPFFDTAGPADTEVDMGFAELVWSPQGGAGRWFFTGLYNFVESDDPVFTIRQGEAGFLDSYQSVAVGGNYLAARNLRLTGEVQYDLDLESYRFIAGFVTAF